MTTYRLPLGSPLQLLLLTCSFALAGYAGVRLLADDWVGVALWFVGAAVVHDLVLLPLYAAADRALVRAADRSGPRTGAAAASPPARRARVMYVRVPAALSGLLLLVWFPLISGRVADRYASATGMSADGSAGGFLGRWLLITALLFAGSALLLVLRARAAARTRPPAAH
ncbi:hypothetical protein [Streptomyces heilongjiangensis]|uniref:Lipoprotein n=1 Tax=Streptomyces heilongjiangensis TaxID=945052 RepID=A0ABW1B0R7_9ACTN|nr:hypothetical protein [Streptomyces heilongjiangensis]MDC2946484.1 hypothetical protein [Streptomyces heilongjiangensis]